MGSRWWRASLSRALLWVGVFAQLGNVGDWSSTLVMVGVYHIPEGGRTVLWAIHKFGLVPGVTIIMAEWAIGFGAAVWVGRRWVETGALPIVVLILTAYFGLLKWLATLTNLFGMLSR